MVIESDDNENKSHNEGVYAAFKEVVKAEDYKAYIKALCLGVNLVYFSLPFFLPSAKTYYL